MGGRSGVKRISPKSLGTVDIVSNMSGRPRTLAFDEYSKVEDCDIEDPYGQDPNTYQRVFEEFDCALQNWLGSAGRGRRGFHASLSE